MTAFSCHSFNSEQELWPNINGTQQPTCHSMGAVGPGQARVVWGAALEPVAAQAP